MKKIIIISVLAIFVIGCLLASVLLVTLIHTDKYEWSLKTKAYELAIPLTLDDLTISEIEEQAYTEAKKIYPSSYLTNLKWKAETNSAFENLTDGNITFTYCANLGNKNGYYPYDRYVYCDIDVDMKRRIINKATVYGNYRMGEGENLKVYPEFEEIRNLLKNYSKMQESDTIIKCNVNETKNDGMSLVFNIIKSDKTIENYEVDIEFYHGSFVLTDSIRHIIEN